jgi:hypothetical protein
MNARGIQSNPDFRSDSVKSDRKPVIRALVTPAFVLKLPLGYPIVGGLK